MDNEGAEVSYCRKVLRATCLRVGIANWWTSFRGKRWPEKCQEIRRLTHRGLLASVGMILFCSLASVANHHICSGDVSKWIDGAMRLVGVPSVMLFSLSAFIWAIELFDRQREFFERWRFRVGGFLVVLAVGAMVYTLVPLNDGARYEDALTALFAATNRALSAFFRSQGGFEDIGGRWWIHFTGCFVYYVYHLAVALYLAALTFSFFGREMMNAFHLWCARDDVAVIWGWSRRGELMAEDLIDHHATEVLFHLDRSLCFDDAKRKPLLEKLSAMKRNGEKDSHPVLWDFVDFKSVDKEAARGKMHFFLSDSGRENIALANRVLKEKPDAKPEFFVRVESSSDERFFSEWFREVGSHVELRIVKESSVIANDLIRRHPIPLHLAGGESQIYRVLIVGFGVNGQAVLNKIIESSQSLGREVHLDVVDARGSSWEAYQVRCPDVTEERYHVRFLGEHRVGTKEFDDWMRAYLGQREQCDRIVACLGDERTTETFCMRIDRLYKEVVKKPLPDKLVFVQVDEDALSWENGDKETCNIPEVARFGKIESIYRKDTIYPESDVRLGMEVNRWYTSRYEGPQDKFPKDVDGATREVALKAEWGTRSYFKQQSNIASAQGMRNVLRMFNCDLVKYDAPGTELDAEGFEELRKAVDQHGRELAEDEHERWMAFHFVRGVRKLVLSEVDSGEWFANGGSLDPEANQIEKLNAHAALVPFDELPAIDRDLDVAGGNDRENAAAAFAAGQYVGKNGVHLARKSSWSSPNLMALQGFDYMFGDLILDVELLHRLGLKIVRIAS